MKDSTMMYVFASVIMVCIVIGAALGMRDEYFLTGVICWAIFVACSAVLDKMEKMGRNE